MSTSNKIREGINGFGRIGRNLFRLLLDHPDIEVVAINDVADPHTLAHLLKYDSLHGVLHRNIKAQGERLFIDGKSYRVSSAKQPGEIDWTSEGVELVIESSGKFKTRELLEPHLQKGVRKVILSVPPQDESIKMIVLGVNEHLLDGSETIISNASCTTNNAGPMLKVIHDRFEVLEAYITTVHSYTTDQSLHDQPHRDLRRARAAATGRRAPRPDRDPLPRQSWSRRSGALRPDPDPRATRRTQ